MSDDKVKPVAEHWDSHIKLHTSLDMLVAHWITSTGKRPSQATVLELLQWSGQQSRQPDHEHL